MSRIHVTDSQVKFGQFGDVLVHFENWMASHWRCVGSVGYVRNSLFVASNICWKMVLDLTLVVDGGSFIVNGAQNAELQYFKLSVFTA